MKIDTTEPAISEDRFMYFWESKRLESFKKWPFKDRSKCSKQKMAEAGFFWVGTKNEPDSAQCFICNKQLDGWESTDEPWQEHKKHANNCLFVTIGKTEESLMLQECYDLFKAMVINLVNKSIDEREKIIILKNEEVTSMFEKFLKS